MSSALDVIPAIRRIALRLSDAPWKAQQLGFLYGPLAIETQLYAPLRALEVAERFITRAELLVEGRLTRAWNSEQLAAIRADYGDERYNSGRFPEAIELFMRMSKSAEFDEFLSLPAYELLP